MGWIAGQGHDVQNRVRLAAVGVWQVRWLYLVLSGSIAPCARPASGTFEPLSRALAACIASATPVTLGFSPKVLHTYPSTQDSREYVLRSLPGLIAFLLDQPQGPCSHQHSQPHSCASLPEPAPKLVRMGQRLVVARHYTLQPLHRSPPRPRR